MMLLEIGEAGPSSGSHAEWIGDAEELVDRMLRNVVHGRFERSLSGLTAVAAVVTTVEIYLEHYKSYNVPMGPPIAAPGLMAMVGGMGLLAAVLRRER